MKGCQSSRYIFHWISKGLKCSNVLPLLLLAALVLLLCLGGSNCSKVAEQGPRFAIEPPNRVVFSNSSGAVINCNAVGDPPPRVSWLRRDSSSTDGLVLASGHFQNLVHVRTDGSLLLSPFVAEHFRSDVHDAVYQCTASNSFGTIASRDVQVRAVLDTRVEVSVTDEFVVIGSSAIVKWTASNSDLQELLNVVAWTRDDGLVISSSPASGSKYSIVPSGHLVIRAADSTDAFRSFEAKVQHRLTGQMYTSINRARLVVTEPQHSMYPKIADGRSSVTAAEGEPLFLACPAQGFPLPMFNWFKYRENSSGRNFQASKERLLEAVEGWTPIGAAGLFASKAASRHSGLFECQANNSLGSDSAQMEVRVYATLSAFVEPEAQREDVGKDVLFRCRVLGFPVTSLAWLFNGRPVKLDSRTVLISRDLLKVTNVQRSDRGVYQCLVSNGHESAQGSGSLDISESPPKFISSFKEELLDVSQRLSLKCSATGNPLPQITWTLDRRPLAEVWHVRVGDYVSDVYTVNSYVNISSIKADDGGLYECRATNSAGQVEHAGRLDIRGPPAVKQMSNATALSSQTTTLDCPWTGHPVSGVFWTRGDRRLPQNHRQKVFANGSLVISEVQRTSDQGWYTCHVTSDGGREARRQMFVEVLVSPVVEQFAFSSDLVAGRRAGVACVVSAGDLPITIEWLKDGLPIDPRLGATVSTSDFTSFLSFTKVTRDHSGNYTCRAENPAAAATFTAPMVVQVPPTWTLQPKDVSVVLGHSITLDARATGFPEPIIRWKRESVASDSNSENNFKVIISNANMQTLENGSLVIREAVKADAGQYMCQAVNGVGPGVSVVLRLTVNVAAHFDIKYEVHSVRKGKSIQLRCKAIGEKPLSITWSKDRQVISSNTEARFTFEEDLKGELTEASIVITAVERSDSGLFSCLASNDFGKDTKNIQLLVQEPPDCPSDLRASDVTSRSLNLVWSHPFAGNSPLTNYLVQLEPVSGGHGGSAGGGRVLKEVVDRGLNSFIVDGLEPRTKYLIGLVATNAIGSSDSCVPIEAQTDEEAPSLPPRDLKVTSKTSTVLTVSWRPPKSSMGAAVQGYYVGYRISGSSDGFAYKTVDAASTSADQNAMSNDASDEVSCTLSGLRKNSKYSILVQAFNGKGAGPPSDEHVAQTQEFDAPSAPLVRIVQTTVSSLTVTWEVAPDGNPVSGFYLFFKTDERDWEELLVTEAQMYNLTNLECGHRYNVYIMGFNNVGRGSPSEVVAAKTEGNSPIAPTVRQLISSNSTFANVNLASWRHGGCAMHYFVVQYKAKVQREWLLLSNRVLPEQSPLIISDLNPATWYSLLVAAVNEAGSTEAEYSFSTLTTSGDAIPAYSVDRATPGELVEHVKLLMPVVLSVLIVLLAMIVVCVFKQKSAHIQHQQQSIYSDGGGGTMSNTPHKMCEVIPLNDCSSEKRRSLNCSNLAETPGSRRMSLYEAAPPGLVANQGQHMHPSPYASSKVSANMFELGPAQATLCKGSGQLTRDFVQLPQHYDVPFKQCLAINHDGAFVTINRNEKLYERLDFNRSDQKCSSFSSPATTAAMYSTVQKDRQKKGCNGGNFVHHHSDGDKMEFSGKLEDHHQHGNVISTSTASLSVGFDKEKSSLGLNQNSSDTESERDDRILIFESDDHSYPSLVAYDLSNGNRHQVTQQLF